MLRERHSDPSPFVRVRRIRLIRHEIREFLWPGAIDLLLAHAEIGLEGSEEITRNGSGTSPKFFATLMITIDLNSCAPHFREPADAATAERVAELLECAPGLHDRLVNVAQPRLAQRLGTDRDQLEIHLEPQVRCDGVTILLDADVVAWHRGHQQR